MVVENPKKKEKKKGKKKKEEDIFDIFDNFGFLYSFVDVILYNKYSNPPFHFLS